MKELPFVTRSKTDPKPEAPETARSQGTARTTTLSSSKTLRVLQTLKRTPNDFVSGTTLAADMALSRTSIWKHIQMLRLLGYDIASHPKLGYRLTDTPDRLISEEVLPGLETRWLAQSYHHLDQTTSTNNDAMSLALQGFPHGTAVVSEQQTQGRGRLQRQWTSVPQLGIYLSMVLRGPLPFNRAPQATMIAALSLARLLRREWHLPASTKWPNDVLIQGRKVAGILTEAKSDQDHVHFLVLGIGINVNHTQEDLSGPFRYPATSLAIEIGRPVKRTELLRSYLRSFEADYERWTVEGFEAFSREWEDFSYILGKLITLNCSEGPVTGQVVGFTSEGALKLLQRDGMEKEIWAGDVARVEGHP
jgi:BirA family transcriptional regulator, biotin operon repressor / biotin---[acetyl-CoA-carboxylase] ligase